MSNGFIYVMHCTLEILSRVAMLPLMLFPRNKDIYIFGSWKGEKYSDNTRHLFVYANKYTHKRCIWICKNNKIKSQVRGYGFECYNAYSISGIYYQLRAGVAFSSVGITDFMPYLLGNCVHIELWHGVGGGKKIGLDDRMYKEYSNRISTKIMKILESFPLRKHFFNATSDTMKAVFKNAFLIPENHFLMNGQPRNDIFYKEEYKFETIGEKEFSNKNVVLYLPTHRKEGEVDFNCHRILHLDEIEAICDKFNCIFLIKKHYYHRNEKENYDKYRNIIDITNAEYDINELLMKSMVVVSDYSSVTTDYLLLDRPIIYYCFDLEHYLKEDRDVYWDYESITPGPKAHTFDEFRKYLVDVLSGKDDYKLERKRVRDMFYDPSCQCEASGKILLAVENIVSTYR